jgi:hypothetical protein
MFTAMAFLEEMDVYHHAMFTSDMTWDPSHFGDDDDTIKVTDPVPTDPRVNQFGEGLGWEHHETYSQVISKNYPDLDSICPYFGWTPLVCIQRTLDVTTQFAHADICLPMRKHMQKPYHDTMTQVVC